MTAGSGDDRARRAGDAAERAARREAQHAVLADLLAAYADGELPAESAARVEAHLVGCTRCRRDLAGQVALRDRLAAEVVHPVPPALREWIVSATAALPAPVLAAPQPGGVAAPARHTGRRWRAAFVVAAVVVLAAMGSAAGWSAGWPALWRARDTAGADAASGAALLPTPAGRVPLVAAALADYRRSTAGDLPGRARDLDAVRDAVGFPVEPIHDPDYRLLAAWTTTLDGEPTAVLAYRSGDRLVVQYLMPEALFFRYWALRAATTVRQPLAGTDGAQAVLAWPEPASGAVLVSDGTPEQLASTLPPLSFQTSPAARDAAQAAEPQRAIPDAGP